MKIISRGEVKEKSYQSKCRQCNSVIEFTKNDGLILTDRNETILKIKCPVCNFDIYKSI